MNVTPTNNDMQNEQCAISSVDDEYNTQQFEESFSPSKQRQETTDGNNKFVSPGEDKDDIYYSQVCVFCVSRKCQTYTFEIP